MKVFLVAGARPNFMKISPLFRESRRHDQVDCRIVHTGQHYDQALSQVFFDDLEIPQPAFHLGVGSASHAQQTARIMVGFEDLCQKERPDLVVVVGDVNSTLACSIVAKKLLIDLAHVEAGLRSFDLTMPEEINRLVTDAISDYLFATEESAVFNLLREGKPQSQIHHVGNVMIDNLYHQLKRLGDSDFTHLEPYKNKDKPFIFLTMHRPSNVDRKEDLAEIVSAFNAIAEEHPILFPVHPRTQKMLRVHEIELSPRIIRLPPLSFRESLFLWKDATLVVTDSGGLQDETTALGVPCLTIRNNTERPVTIAMGTNMLGGTTRGTILPVYRELLKRSKESHSVPPKWDGRTSKRVWHILLGKGENG